MLSWQTLVSRPLRPCQWWDREPLGSLMSSMPHRDRSRTLTECEISREPIRKHKSLCYRLSCQVCYIFITVECTLCACAGTCSVYFKCSNRERRTRAVMDLRSLAIKISSEAVPPAPNSELCLITSGCAYYHYLCDGVDDKVSGNSPAGGISMSSPLLGLGVWLP